MSTRPVSKRPVPVADELSAPFWEAVGRHELVLQTCAACEVARHPPRERCPSCGSRERGVWRPATQPLRLESWTTIYVDVLPDMPPPFTVGQAGIETEPYVEIVAEIVVDDLADLCMHRPLSAGFVDLESPDGAPFALLQLRPGVAQ